MKIYLIRHGQTTGDLEDRFGGDYDDHLTDLGEDQSQELANQLQGEGIEKIFTSPKIRAQETAKILNQKIKSEIGVINNLRERNHYGILTGMVKSEAKERFPQEFEKVKDYHQAAKNGENYEDFKRRISEALEYIRSKPLNTVAIISHGGPIRMIFREILKAGEIEIKDCAFAVLNSTDVSLEMIQSKGIRKL